MAIVFERTAEKRRYDDSEEHDQEVIGSLCSLGGSSPKSQTESEKRLRRQIANSNERRRMQSINAGFQSLRNLLPHGEGEKLSKSTILQQTTEYIFQLEQEKSRLLAQNCQLKRLIGQGKKDPLGLSMTLSPEPSSDVSLAGTDECIKGLHDDVKSDCPQQLQQREKDKRKGMLTGEAYSRAVDRLRKEVNELRALLDAERKLRLRLEEQIQALESHLQLQIDVPDMDSADLTAQILGRKPNMPSRDDKDVDRVDEVNVTDTVDDDSSLMAAARSASSRAVRTTRPAKRNNSLSTVTRIRNAAMSPSVSRAELVSSPGLSTSQNQVQFLSHPSALTTLAAIPAHLVLDDRPNRDRGSLLEAAIMAEPKVEVEIASRVPSPALSLSMAGGPGSPATLPLSSLPVISILPHNLSHLTSDGSASPLVLQHSGEEVTLVDIDGHLTTDTKSYLAATSRQNLETIVEAIRHLEGDHLFNDDTGDNREGALVQVEIDPDAIGCSLVVTSDQDESETVVQGSPLQIAVTTSDQDIGEMITVATDVHSESETLTL